MSDSQYGFDTVYATPHGRVESVVFNYEDGTFIRLLMPYGYYLTIEKDPSYIDDESEKKGC